MIHLVLCDGKEFIRLGVRYLCERQHDIELVGEVCSCNELVELCRLVKPDVVLLGMSLNYEDVGITVSEVLKFCATVMIFTESKDRQLHLQVLRSGVMGIVTHDQGADMLVKAIRAASQGEMWFDRNIALDLLKQDKEDSVRELALEEPKEKCGFEKYNLTVREQEIARYAANGLTAKDIATKLFISQKTVRNQLVVIYSKLDVSSQVELVLMACRLQLIH